MKSTISRSASIIAAAALLTACGPAGEPPTSDQGRGHTAPSGWAINPPGDLNQFFECLEAEGLALVSAHRGGPYPGYPENALETFRHILAQAPAALEIDVAASADGVLYLMHDDTLERTTTGEGPADGLDWASIKALRLQDNDGKSMPYAPTRFADALSWATGRTILQIDFKPSARYEAVIAEVSRQGAGTRVIYIAYSLASARKLHRLAPDVMISLSINSQSELNAAVAAGVPANRLMGFTGLESPRPRLFNLLNARDVEVIFGTLGGRASIDNQIARSGDDAQYADLAQAGVDIIATDRPIEAHGALEAAGRAAKDGVCGVRKG